MFVERTLYRGLLGSGGLPTLGRRDREVSVPYGGGRIRGDGVYPRWRPGYALRVFPGGVQDELRFCMTGKQGFSGQLTAADILNQPYSLPERDTLTNVVFMGQGEPLDNLDNVLRATEILTADYAMPGVLSALRCLPSDCARG